VPHATEPGRPLLFKNATLAFPDFFSRGELLVEDGAIKNIWIEEKSSHVPATAEFIDCGGAILAPGLVDIHNNGALGHEFIGADPEGNNRALDWHAKQGVTSVLATVMTETEDQMARAVSTLAQQQKTGTISPNFAGIHIEGPYFHPDKRGAHRLECLRHAKPSEYQKLHQLAEGTLRLFTFAPEIPGTLELCSFLHTAGIIPTLGHTTATFEQIQRAAACGARHFVHAHNAMDWPTRKPSSDGWLATELMPMGSLLSDSRFTCEIIADGYHVPWPLIQAIVRAKGMDAIALVSDASSACGCSPGTYSLAGMEIELLEDRLMVARGTKVQGVAPLAGSGTSLLWMVQNAWRWGGSLLAALKMATLIPARIAGLERKGQLLVGNDVDLILLDATGDLQNVFIGGKRLDEQMRLQGPGSAKGRV
jgi:N-acetylglucosamine-6-phosphate deacetylase